MYTSFRPGKFWYDTDGKRIQAHGGSILYADGVYYWYGENKEGITGRATGEACKFWHGGVRLYSSRDLYNWKDEGVILVDYEDEENPFYVGRIMDRPHILYNAKRKKFVLWAKIGGVIARGGDFSDCYFAVAESDNVTGEYTLVAKLTDLPAGDFDLFEADGKGYVVFEKPHTEVICWQLNADYTGYDGAFISHLPSPFPPYTREAPAYFERRGRRFLLTSGTTGYFPNQSKIAEITNLHGEWTDLGNACVGDVRNNSFHAQFSSVFRHPTIEDLYIALGDRWLNDIALDAPNADLMFESWFNDKVTPEREYRLTEYTDENTSEATYVWLPIRFDDTGKPYIAWQAEWRWEDFEARE